MLSSSDDDMPLANKSNGHSEPKISKALDRAMDNASSGHGSAPAGVSIRNGPVLSDRMDVDGSPVANGKRKARTSNGTKASQRQDSSDESDVKPLLKRQKKSKKAAQESDSDAPIARRKSGGVLPPKIDDDSSDGEPIIAKLAKKKTDIEKKAAKEAKAIRAKGEKKAKKEDSSDDDKPLAKMKAKPKATARKSNGVNTEVSDDDKPLAKTKVNGKTASASGTPAKRSKAKKEVVTEGDEEAEEEEYRWWDAPKKEDDSIKWETLQHNGVIFPPEYEPLPKNVRLFYDGKPVTMQPEAEEVAGFFGAMLNSTHNVENPTFVKNFFQDFQEILKKSGGAKDSKGEKVAIKEFSKLNFQQIFDYYHGKSEERKARPAAEKKAEKAAKDAIEAPYMYCQWDGRKEKVGNFRVEPPGLFRGRGEHPKTGRVKHRVRPEQITINIGREAMVPAPPEGHRWKEIKHDNEATWLVMWQENINNAFKYVMLAANSAIKGQSDFKKFEKARELKMHIDRIRKDYNKALRSEFMADRQRATAVYLIDKFALRAGNEKDTENEAETVGCCSLKYEHVTLKPPNTVIFDFLGKDSIRFYDEVTVDIQVFKNLKMFKKEPKKDGDDIFDRLTTTQLNKHLTNYMPGLSAKVFRTYNASNTMSKLLQDLLNKYSGKKAKALSMPEKMKHYNDANREVAILCNHKRTVTASHGAQMEKLGDRIKGLKYQKWRTKQMMLSLDATLKKKKGAEFFALEPELTPEWITDHQAFLVAEQKTKIEKKFQKENEKLTADGDKEMKPKDLEGRLKVVDELKKKLATENKTMHVEAEGSSPTVEKLEAAIEKIDARIQTMEMQAEDREGNKEVALGTSKINYIDPRLTVVFARKFDVPIEKFFSKTLREKFNWAIKSVEDVDDWEF